MSQASPVRESPSARPGAWVLFAGALATGAALVPPGQSRATDTDAPATAWQGRRDDLRKLRATWRETVFFPKGSLSASSPELVSPPGAVVPPEPRQFEHEVECALDGPRFRLRGPQTQWNFDKGRFVTATLVVAFDGERTTRLIRGADDLTEMENAVTKAGFQANWVPVHWRTWLAAVRTGDATLAQVTAPAGLAVEPREEAMDGAVCRVLTRRNAAGQLDYRLWAEPAAGYRLRRAVSYDLGQPVRTETLTYPAAPGLSGVPGRWKVVSVHGDRLTRQYECAVMAADRGPVTNADLRPEDLRGGLVTAFGPDDRMTHEYVRADGSRRPVPDWELGNISTAPSGGGRAAVLRLAVPVGVALIGVGVWLWWRRRRSGA